MADKKLYEIKDETNFEVIPKETITIEPFKEISRQEPIDFGKHWQDESVTPIPTMAPKPNLIPEADIELMQIVALEYDRTYLGALAVATVIMNRLADGRWGDTIHDVVSAPKQFSTYKNRDDAFLNLQVRSACAIVQYNGYRSFPANVMWFCTPSHYKRSKFFQGLKIYERSHKTVWCYAD